MFCVGGKVNRCKTNRSNETISLKSMIDHWNDAQRIESEEKSRRAVGDTGVN